MLTNCAGNTLFGFNIETQMIESLNTRWTIENRVSLNPPSSRDHAILQTVVSPKGKPENYQVISYSIATSEVHLNEICERAKGRYNATTNLLLYNTVGISLSCLAAMLEDDEDQESRDDYDCPIIEEPSMMRLDKARDRVESFKVDDGYRIPVCLSQEKGLVYDPSPPPKNENFVVFPRLIPAVRFLRATGS